jgi:hypothetical protein
MVFEFKDISFQMYTEFYPTFCYNAKLIYSKQFYIGENSHVTVQLLNQIFLIYHVQECHTSTVYQYVGFILT